jgi:hypothetical protein
VGKGVEADERKRNRVCVYVPAPPTPEVMAVTFMVAESMEDARLVGGMDDGNDDVAEMESDFVSKCSRIRLALGCIDMWHTFLKTVVTLPFLRRSIAALLIYLLDHNLSPFLH